MHDLELCIHRATCVGDFSHIFTVHAQKRLFMSLRLKFWHRHSIPWPLFLYTARCFGDLKTFSVDFCIKSAECPPYFDFRSSWPTDLESVWRVYPLTLKNFTKFEEYMTIRCLVEHSYYWYVRWPCDLDLWPFVPVSAHTWPVTWSTPLPSLKILRLSVVDLELRHLL